MLERHGGDWAGFEKEYGREALDFSANISPLGMPENVRRAAAESLRMAHRYPDPFCRELREKLGEALAVPPEWILCGTGAADLIWRLVWALHPKRALVTAPTFGEYEAAMDSCGCEIQRYFLKEKQNFRLDADILKEITERTDIVFLCEPNNPTGITSDRTLLMRVLEKCRNCGCLLAVDECFQDFLEDESAHTLMKEVKNGNLLIFRAFTKFYGMAGLRLGYCVTAETALQQKMLKSGQPWAVSIPAQAAGIAALEEKAYAEKLHTLIWEQRKLLAEGLEKLGCRVIPGEANYLLLYTKDENLSQKLRQAGILIRDCRDYQGLCPGWYRAAVRTESENRALLAAMERIL